MIGYLMNFFKYAAVDTDDFEDADKLYLNAHEGEYFVRSVVWSVFDRIEVRDIDTFDQFRLSQYSEKKWIGERQFTLLYEIAPEEKYLEYKKSTDKCLFAFHKVYDDSMSAEEKERDEEKYRFFGISMIDLVPEVHNDFYETNQPGTNMYMAMRKILKELCSKNNIDENKICFEIYGTLGGNDLVVIWLANEFKDVVIVLEALRKSHIKYTNKSIVANVATIMGLRDINNDRINYDNVAGQLNIRFTKKGTYDHDEFKKALCSVLEEEQITFETTLGEHDLSLKIPGIKLTKKLYNEKGIIHIKTPEFLHNIIQANTELSVDIDYALLQAVEYDQTKRFQRTVITLSEKDEVYKEIEDIANNDMFCELPYLKETLWILYEDYLRNISSSFSYPWISDLHYQFKSSMKYLKKLLNDDDSISKDKKYESVKELISTIRQTILHVSQANRLFFEIPNTHLKNTGSYSKILRTYSGIVKQLLLQAYSIPRYGTQTTIVPFITFDVIPKISSTLLPRIPNSEYIVVNIVLPYEAFVNIPKYAKLLAHEVYHYIAPRDRAARNTTIGIICVALFISQMLIRYVDETVRELLGESYRKFDLKPYINIINEKTLKAVIAEYEGLMSYIEDYNADDEWMTYFSKLHSVYSEYSGEFPKLENLHYHIYEIFKEVSKTSLDGIGLDNDEKKKLENAFRNELQNKFIRWLIDKGYRKPNNFIKEVKYALREIAPDLFMLQVMEKEERIKNYYQLVLHYKDLLITEEKEIEKIYRIGMMTDYLFSDITNDLGKKDTKEITLKIKEELADKTDATDEEQQYVITRFIQYYEVLKQYRGLILLYMQGMEFNSFANEEFNKILIETRRLLNDQVADDFQKSVQYVECFQVQRSLEDIASFKRYDFTNREGAIKEIREKLNIGSTDSIFKKQEGLFAWNVNSLIRCIDDAAKEIADDKEMVWFRGHRSYKYKLVPSIYRMKDEKNEFYKGITPRDVMEPLFKSFKVRAFGAKEIYEGGADSLIGILVSMQHYSVPTNILDWTTSVFHAIYFAVEDYMANSEKERIKRKVPDEDAEIWILNPIRLNKARAYLNSKRSEPGIMWEYPIPSIYGNEDEYKEYIPFTKNKEALNEPVAVYVPHVNQRIKAQLGTFTMFSLDSKGEEKGDGVVFKDLLSVQEQYKEKVTAEEYRPFLVSVRISKNCLWEIADWLRRMGVTKPNIYPELSNISEVLTEEIRDYWEEKVKDN